MFLETDAVRSSRRLKWAAFSRDRRYPFRLSPKIHISPTFNCTASNFSSKRQIANRANTVDNSLSP